MLTNIIVCATLLLCSICLACASIFVMDPLKNKMIELTGAGVPCKIHAGRNIIDNMIHKVDSRYIQRMSGRDFEDLAHKCRDVDGINKRGGFIFPGTKWCGPGNVANGYDDLGIYTAEDRCCRDHDHCPNQLEPGQCKQSVCNTSPFTRSHCDCDSTFKRCLREVGSEVANTIGILYFNIAQVTCFTDRRACPEWMRGCKMGLYAMTHYHPREGRQHRDRPDHLVSNFVSGLLHDFLRFGQNR